MKSTVFSIILITLFSSCKKPKELRGNYFAFGKYHSECSGNCATFFLIKSDALYPDNMNYWDGELKFRKEKLSQEKYLLAKNLVDNLPSFFKENPSGTFGCPDCYDQGGYYIEFKDARNSKFFWIDADKKSQSLEIRDYIVALNDILEQL